MMLQAIDFMQGPSYEIIIVGKKAKSEKLIKEIQKHPQFNKVLILKDEKYDKEIFNFLEFYDSDKYGDPLVYVCQNFTCDLPTDDIAKIYDLLE